MGTAEQLLLLDPSNSVALHCMRLFGRPQRTEETRSHQPEPAMATTKSSKPLPDVGRTVEDLEREYKALKLNATIILEEFQHITNNHQDPSTRDQDTEILEKLKAMRDGKVSAIVPAAQPLSVRESSRNIRNSARGKPDLIAEDFESVVEWAKFQSPPLPTDAIRERLIKRKALLDAALPENLAPLTTAAFANIERKYLQKKYENTETMLGDEIKDIPPQNFFASEDNYAWDMDELASAISANGGVMRNPLSRQMFSDADIRLILQHPLGQRLRPQHEAQHRMKRGFRTATVDWVEKLGSTMLQDQSSDAGPSRRSMDEFLAYVITLPDTEQQIINTLKIPGRDRNTGQEYDYAIGESVRDAKANTTCFHKVSSYVS